MRVRKTRSKAATRCLALLVGIGLGLSIPTNIALADDRIDLKELTPVWWQWAFSIPAAQNPIADPKGGNCMIGQRGSIWFLAGNFGGTTTRTCSVPAGLTLFFPIVNQAGFNSPAVPPATDNCGQGRENISAKDLRKAIGGFIDSIRLGALSVELDDHPIYHFERVQSDVFVIALPAGNIGGCAPGVYSPAVDDGYYVKLDPLNVGRHTLHIRSTAPQFSFDVAYTLTVVKVSDK